MPVVRWFSHHSISFCATSAASSHQPICSATGWAMVSPLRSGVVAEITRVPATVLEISYPASTALVPRTV